MFPAWRSRFASALVLCGLVGGCGSVSSSKPTDAASTVDAPGDASPVADTALDMSSVDVASDASTSTDTSTSDGPASAEVGIDATDARDVAPPSEAGVDATPHDASATGCTSTSCGDGMKCAYAIADGCAAIGHCEMIPVGSGCGAIVLEQACGCDGSAVTWTGGCHPQLPDGYAPAPAKHMGVCP